MTSTRNLFAALALLLTTALTATAQQGFMPVLENFDKTTYGGALQNWSVTQDTTGRLWVGNGAGLLDFDGYNWRLTRLPDGAVARSVLAVGRRVYVGTYLDFGYFERRPDGTMAYTSLWPKDFKAHEDEIWNIVTDSRGHVFFQSFNSWFDYDGRRVTSHYDAKLPPLYFFGAEGQVLVQINRGHFYRLLPDGRLQLLFTRDKVGGDHVVAARSVGPGRLLLCTQWHGIYTLTLTPAGKATVRRLPTQADAALTTTNVNRATWLPHDSLLVVGTILGGIYAIDPHGRQHWHYSMAGGLRNNSVLALLTDAQGGVWAALDAGVAHIFTGMPYSVLKPAASQPSLGMVYGLCATPQGLYVATNQATWLVAPDATRLVAGSQGQNWYVGRFGRQVLLGNNVVTKVVHGTVATPISSIEQNSSTCLRECVIGNQHVLLESSYYTLRVYRQQSDGTWQFSHNVQGFGAPVSQMEVDAQGRIWCSHMSRGLLCATLSADLRRATCVTYDHLGHDGPHGRNRVMKVRGRVVFTQGSEFYTYDDLHSRLVPFHALDSIVGTDVPLSATATADPDLFWLACARGFSLVRYDGHRYRRLWHVTPGLFGLESNEQQCAVYVDGRYAYFGLNGGIGRYDMRYGAPPASAASLRPRLAIMAVTTTDEHGRAEHLPVAATRAHAATAQGNVTITLTYPNFGHDDLQFCYTLTGGGIDIDSVTTEPLVTFGSLPYGTYHFTCRVQRTDGTQLSAIDYWLECPRPLWQSWWAWLLYAALLALGIYLLVRYRTRKAEERLRRQFADKKLQDDLAKLEQERQQAEQQKQQLETELSDKSREVATMALEAARSTTTIVGLKDAIRARHRHGDITEAQMMALLRQIGDNPDSRRHWQTFEQQFDLVHNNYFKRLKQQFPSLTPSDLRFCALLRMNLTTKQMAEFNGMSVRGVEGARYRLRKKLQLPEGTSLVDFLIHFE